MASHGVPRVSGAPSIDKSEAAKQKERKQIEAYKDLERDVIQRIKAKDYTNATFQLTSTLLSQNPEYYTIWNHRRLLLQEVFRQEFANLPSSLAEPSGPTTTTSSISDTATTTPSLTPAQTEISLLIREDLTFLLPLLKQFPKCYWIWNHRSWLLSTATAHLPASAATGFWQGELALIGKMLALDSRNFHGWGYRRTVVGEIERLGGDGSGRSMKESELEYTTKMINTNLSNFSAWHYRSTLLPSVLDERSASKEERRSVLDAEFELITQALYTDPYDQSLWFYHQFLLASLDPGNVQAGEILRPCEPVERKLYLEREVGSAREMLEGAEDCKYIYQALLEYSRQLLGVVDAGADIGVTQGEMRGWLAELMKLDPLREGRWKELERELKL